MNCEKLVQLSTALVICLLAYFIISLLQCFWWVNYQSTVILRSQELLNWIKLKYEGHWGQMTVIFSSSSMLKLSCLICMPSIVQQPSQFPLAILQKQKMDSREDLTTPASQSREDAWSEVPSWIDSITWVEAHRQADDQHHKAHSEGFQASGDWVVIRVHYSQDTHNQCSSSDHLRYRERGISLLSDTFNCTLQYVLFSKSQSYPDQNTGADYNIFTFTGTLIMLLI